jgi:hypothetical protein
VLQYETPDERVKLAGLCCEIGPRRRLASVKHRAPDPVRVRKVPRRRFAAVYPHQCPIGRGDRLPAAQTPEFADDRLLLGLLETARGHCHLDHAVYESYGGLRFCASFRQGLDRRDQREESRGVG